MLISVEFSFKLPVFSNDRKYAIFGMEDGAIRVCRVNSQDDADFSDYWILSMHDNMNGRVTSMRLSTDERILLTCGHDGNVFSYTVNDDSPPEIEVPIPTRSVVMVNHYFRIARTCVTVRRVL